MKIIEWAVEEIIYLLITVPVTGYNYYLLPNTRQIDYTIDIPFKDGVKSIQDSISIRDFPVNTIELIGKADNIPQWNEICTNYNLNPQATLIAKKI